MSLNGLFYRGFALKWKSILVTEAIDVPYL